MSENDNAISLLSIKTITDRASKRWDDKSTAERLKTSLKYRHIFARYNLEKNDWSNPFSSLSRHQKKILLKGELIRTYDAMSNKDKSKVKEHFHLPKFSSKWFKLDPKSKKMLLKGVLANEG